jgi:hypothetical protein
MSQLAAFLEWLEPLLPLAPAATELLTPDEWQRSASQGLLSWRSLGLI